MLCQSDFALSICKHTKEEQRSKTTYHITVLPEGSVRRVGVYNVAEKEIVQGVAAVGEVLALLRVVQPEFRKQFVEVRDGLRARRRLCLGETLKFTSKHTDAHAAHGHGRVARVKGVFEGCGGVAAVGGSGEELASACGNCDVVDMPKYGV